METESRQEKLKKLPKFWKAHLDKWKESGLTTRILPIAQSDLPSFRVLESPV